MRERKRRRLVSGGQSGGTFFAGVASSQKVGATDSQELDLLAS